MDRVKVDLQNCYGIKALHHQFEFDENRAIAIYAPNGSMKSSLALTFRDLSRGDQPRDRFFPDRVPVADVTDQDDRPVANGRVLVVLSYDDTFGRSEKTCGLLLDRELSAEIEGIESGITEAKDALISLLKRQSKSKMNLEAEIGSAIMSDPNDFGGALGRVEAELNKQEEVPFADVEYDQIFAPELIEALNKDDLKADILEYIERNNELLEESNFFSKDVFDYYNAEEVAKNLTKNGFFKASHTVSLRSAGKIVEITTQAELQALIEAEKELIIKDPKLIATFNKIQAALSQNAPLRKLRGYLMNNRSLLPHLGNLGKFKNDVIKSYLNSHKDSYDTLMARYKAAEERIKKIEELAAAENAKWEEVVDIFNARFIVPFTLHVKNRVKVRLGQAKLMELGFVYHDYADPSKTSVVNERDLIEWLSNGEKKAYYVLQVMFEIERRRQENEETLVVIDDIADSFDYQNKYAIIQYLVDTAEDGPFKQIILTHNFDFFRTIQSRFVGRQNCLMVLKTDAGITLEQAVAVNDIFSSNWKANFFNDDRKKVACIPFLRNLIQIKEGSADPTFRELTRLLHWRPETAGLTVGNLDAAYNIVCGPGGPSADPAQPIYDLVVSVADALPPPAGINLENKIVLAIAIRLRAERFMVERIAEQAFWEGLGKFQTPKLIKRFKAKFGGETETIKTLAEVSLMTPENIHLNSFMYEPLIDMDDGNLRKLYEKVKALT